MSLAYVFWHWRADAVDPAAYEARLRAFQATLVATGAVAGGGVQSFALHRAPWDGAAPAPYEDWYLVGDWAALGTLNERAVTGRRRAPHDEVARASAKGAGAVTRLVRAGSAPLAEVRHAAWLDRPSDVDSTDFAALLERCGDVTVFQRQLVLGPAPEFALLSHAPIEPPPGAVLTAPRAL